MADLSDLLGSKHKLTVIMACLADAMKYKDETLQKIIVAGIDDAYTRIEMKMTAARLDRSCSEMEALGIDPALRDAICQVRRMPLSAGAASVERAQPPEGRATFDVAAPQVAMRLSERLGR